MILPTEDPLNRTPFGADERQLSEIYSYRKAIRELKTKSYRTGKGDESDGEQAANEPEKGKGRGRGSPKEK